MRRTTGHHGLLGLFMAATLLLGACGGGDDTSATAGSESGSTDSGSTDSGSTDSGGNDVSGAGGGFEQIAFDASALSGGSLGTVAGSAPAVAPVVDTCAALPVDTVAEIYTAVEEEYGWGDALDFTAAADGASCILTGGGVHVLSLTIGSAGEVFPDFTSAAVPVPIGAGELTVSPWATDPAVSILSEDSFDLDTPFAAHVAVGDVGIVVGNLAGTGVDASTDGELFARLAAAAADGLASAPAVEGDANGPTTLPCAVWTIEELDAFLPEISITSDSEVTMDGGCVWTTDDFFHEVSLRVEPESEIEALGLTPVSEGSAVLASDFRAVGVHGDGVFLRIRVEDRSNELDGTDAALALAENLASRLG